MIRVLSTLLLLPVWLHAAKLGLEKTVQRNGVLILISHMEHRLAIFGDAGIHAKAGQIYWDKAAEALLAHFKERRYGEGVEACVRMIGSELAKDFPQIGESTNEFSDGVSES